MNEYTYVYEYKLLFRNKKKKENERGWNGGDTHTCISFACSISIFIALVESVSGEVSYVYIDPYLPPIAWLVVQSNCACNREMKFDRYKRQRHNFLSPSIAHSLFFFFIFSFTYTKKKPSSEFYFLHIHTYLFSLYIYIHICYTRTILPSAFYLIPI